MCDYCGTLGESMPKTIEYKHICDKCTERYETVKEKAQAAYDKIMMEFDHEKTA
jgi:hypothetical protein